MNIIRIDELEDKRLINETAHTTKQLISACYYGHVELVRYLLNTGPIDLTLLDEHGRDSSTALTDGSPPRASEIAQLLLKAGLSDPSLSFMVNNYQDLIKSQTINQALEHYSKVYSGICTTITALPMISIPSPLSTNINSTIYGYSGESWPLINGKPAPYSLQLNFEEAKYVPSDLKALSLLTFFADFSRELGKVEGNGWIIRTYTSMRGLVPIKKDKKSFWPFQLFERSRSNTNTGLAVSIAGTCKDFALYPEGAVNFNLPNQNLTHEEQDTFCHWVSSLHGYGSKLGGHPSLIQGLPWWEKSRHPAQPRYCFQLASDPFLGIEYPKSVLIFGRGTTEGYRNQWFLDVQLF